MAVIAKGVADNGAAAPRFRPPRSTMERFHGFSGTAGRLVSSVRQRSRAMSPKPAFTDKSVIGAGRESDKTPGFDPATAPLETDAEAAGTRTDETGNGAVRSAPHFRNQATFANAMRPARGAPRPGHIGPVLVIVAVVVAVLVVLGLVAVLR
jgi:hypothetical protein